ncbi:protein-glutamate O-methyltransferase CheR [Pseudoalteromonas sp. S3776]|uniref:Protein-glutamate O-methyltransferase CheR n=1 Tax=Pseudoalteromonas undina TaxID=43660 RepID=A0ACC6R9F9_9GAMM|nr:MULTISPECIES: protein-glutamate O-methyltransferase CheR [unclassified Pseudoalteromonas]KPZ52245.1 Chemotaxis protein methyltransferase Cher2 [Pseudoalteromonas sp. P1-13-1a]KPZ54550.1 Chemotaxis protein methyltransferase Cher2 [Pseudoalteromonas sp. P1-25]KPZ61030.1 Chemotaxis protein methyltransferase Cher2 [Pseudoalteromonas sp. P1-7a]TMO75458.1 protein-glutamate O-methyltransferase CheR [Pseudoalteromonas sp. S3785]TMO80832.1 protein-glutamate O-methyltransferase CheR [Pseudoalteromona
MNNKDLQQSDYDQFRSFLEQQCGIVLGENKQYLVKSRLAPLMARFNVESLSQLVSKTLAPHERQLRAAVVDAMTTNETLWFRDQYPFELLKNKLFPEFKDTRRPVKIWSAASSSGQEPYSIAMSVAEFQAQQPGVLRMGAQIIGTDISNTMLDMCKNAEYDALALARGLSAERRKKYFMDSGNGMAKVVDSVRKQVSFRHLNLLDSYALMGKFDIIFCRNVLIYFSPEVKAKIISQFAQALNPKGYLFLGASESMTGLSNEFDMVRCNPGIIYQKK